MIKQNPLKPAEAAIVPTVSLKLLVYMALHIIMGIRFQHDIYILLCIYFVLYNEAVQLICRRQIKTLKPKTRFRRNFRRMLSFQ